jgi:GntR family transcriptional regulator of vanillate catabolism
MILQGLLRPGEHVTEAALAEKLGLSRTPIRQALPALAEEGLLERGDGRGYVVKSFTFHDVLSALDIRGALEGIAARIVAERGASQRLINELTYCLDEGDALFEGTRLSPGDELSYSRLNSRFHFLIIKAAENAMLEDHIQRIGRIPFAGVQAVVAYPGSLEKMTAILSYAHRQHHAIVDAISKGQGARVESLMREHVAPIREGLSLLKQRIIETGQSEMDVELGFAHLAKAVRATEGV